MIKLKTANKRGGQMKLLIVDDEELTRNGLISSIDWEKLGITEIYQADDGVHGIEVARKHSPDIILCDIRMPRMDGISMLKQIESFLPEVSAIFMSGYSDKEYLKAAIKLKAINYIEKPINPKEIQESIQTAMEQIAIKMVQSNAANADKNRISAQLAYCLTVPYKSCKDSIDKLCNQYDGFFACEKFQYICTYIIKLNEKTNEALNLSSAYLTLNTYLSNMNLHVIYSEKRTHHVVLHIYGAHSFSNNTQQLIARKLYDIFSVLGEFYISIGDIVEGIANAYNSYTAAVIALQSSFFFEPGTILCREKITALVKVNVLDVTKEVSQYLSALEDNNETEVTNSLNVLEHLLYYSKGILVNQLKGIYYDMFSALYKMRKKHQMSLDFCLESQSNIMDIMDKCFSFHELHSTLIEKTKDYFSSNKDCNPENSLIYMIREYISLHYQDTDLSVKSISTYANLSASYACTLFKNETGMTLNQYITEFRMNKAKQLLADPRNRISEISSSVGYSDGNYFGKSFRKFTGLSPSDYRDQVLVK